MKPFHTLSLVLFSTFFIALLFFSCSKEPEEITVIQVSSDTVTIVDTITVLQTIIDTLPDTATTFILIRHAETSGGGSNPNLSAAGQNRSTILSSMLANVPLDAVFSTDFNRTMETASPTATAQNLTVTNYNAFALESFVDTNLPVYKKGVILVVGHSNTTPDLLNVLVGDNTYTNLPETEYNNLFVVTVFEKGRSRVLHMTYGN